MHGVTMKTVEDVIKDWSFEERDLLQNLISECKGREARNFINCEANEKALAELRESIDKLLDNLRKFEEYVQQMADDLVLDTYLMMTRQDIQGSA